MCIIFIKYGGQWKTGICVHGHQLSSLSGTFQIFFERILIGRCNVCLTLFSYIQRFRYGVL